MAMDTPAAATSTHSGSRSRGWYGMVVFAATILVLLGIFHAIAGLVALFVEDYFLVTQSGW